MAIPQRERLSLPKWERSGLDLLNSLRRVHHGRGKETAQHTPDNHEIRLSESSVFEIQTQQTTDYSPRRSRRQFKLRARDIL